ncbi:protein LEAD-SENSITIVE 1-like [Cornus florida]|uniref:protein LEAD-SENSITIVE 1-like n=1 Tax=Cornus florida TaxID=4283 RepID=UPI00289A33D2|nr:protein LEAD-SENSITIVE 1-like [Cornus florida]
MSEHRERERLGIRELWSNKISREKLREGDHIYSWRKGSLYAHHGIYNAAQERVIHFTRAADQESGIPKLDKSAEKFTSSDNPCPSCGYHSKLDGVISSCIDCFLSDGELYRYQYDVSWTFYKLKRRGTCTRKASDAPIDVLSRAQTFLDDGFGEYHVVTNNCENFAITCKTGEGDGTATGQAAFFLRTVPDFLRDRFSSIN